MNDQPQYQYRLAIPASSEEIDMEEATGITNPNLHRRIEEDPTPIIDDEFAPREYKLFLNGTNSYRFVKISNYDMNTNPDEIP